jgi:signal transduction histidine kinase
MEVRNVTESAKFQNDVPLETSIPGTSLESILCTQELRNRPSRSPEYEMENRALVALASALADSPRTILQTLADKVVEVLHADSAGLSLLTKDEKRFYWAAVAGAWRPNIGAETLRNFGPCGDVLDHNVPMLFNHWERRYPYLRREMPRAEEGLLVPFYVNGKAVGTIWAVAHDNRRKFDAEDLRLLERMSRFASAAYQTVASIENLKLQMSAREKAETELRELTNGLEAQVRARTEALARAQSELAHVTRVTSLGALTASIAHEVNQPLSGIITNASTCLRMLAADPPNVDGARETARRTIRDGNRASDVITRLRALFSKKEATTESVDLNEATREVIALSLSELQRNRVILRTELADDLPLVTGDRVQLQQVVLNLLQNASDAMSGVDDRPRQLLIRTEREEGDRVRLSVQDGGVGFDAQTMDRLFEAFYTTKNDGMGMGLSVSRSIIERHRGCLWATPNDGPGATFSFSIPCGPGSVTGARSLGVIRTPATKDAE